MANILLVDDEADLISILSDLLAAAGHSVDSATDGEIALKKIENNKFNLIITDIMLPKFDGWHIAKKVKESPNASGTPVLIMTAKTDNIAKPFDNHEFLGTVQHLLSLKD